MQTITAAPDRIRRLNQTQQAAVDAWLANGGVGTLMLSVGLGKTITAMKAAYAARERGLLTGTRPRIRFFAETDARRITLYQDEIPKFAELTGKRFDEDFELQFHCYQGMPAYDGSQMDIYDEIHDSATGKYHRNILDGAPLKLGLTGAMSMTAPVFRADVPEELWGKARQAAADTRAGRITEHINKGQLLQVLCPIVYRVTSAEAIEQGLLSPYRTVIIRHSFSTEPNYKPLWSKSVGKTSEQNYYAARERILMDYNQPRAKKQNMGRAMARTLQSLPSKIPPAIKLIQALEGKTIVFGTFLNYLEQIVGADAVVRGDADELVRQFNAGERDLIASAKKLKQGITLQGVQNMVLVSYNSQPHNLEQMLGRVIRYVEGKQANLYIFVTGRSLEEKWIRRMSEIRDVRGRLERKLDLNVQRYIDSRQLLLNPHANVL